MNPNREMLEFSFSNMVITWRKGLPGLQINSSIETMFRLLRIEAANATPGLEDFFPLFEAVLASLESVTETMKETIVATNNLRSQITDVESQVFLFDSIDSLTRDISTCIKKTTDALNFNFHPSDSNGSMKKEMIDHILLCMTKFQKATMSFRQSLKELLSKEEDLTFTSTQKAQDSVLDDFSSGVITPEQMRNRMTEFASLDSRRSGGIGFIDGNSIRW